MKNLTIRQQVIDEYIKNKISFFKLSKKYKVNRNTVSDWIRKEGIKTKYFKEVPENEVINLYQKKKLSVRKISLKFNVSVSPVRKILNKNNIKIRDNSERHIGQIPWNKGKKWSKEIIKKFKDSVPDRNGKKNPNWQGGKSFEPYPLNWKKALKESIRIRDRFRCRICGKKQGKYKFCVHHIDYDKNNCNPNNLITLCVKCHTKTNGNREYWKQYLTQLLNKSG